MKHSGKFAWAAAAIGLLAYEAWALGTGHETLSRAVYEMSEAWGMLPALMGFVAGMLFAHFFWRWEPDKGKKGGG